ncbi:condensation domain-containing protein [Streptomyces angustmyceticus]|uniref:condensation domain-containing protein n=1 Tax=Streptomyces angustmyceticus TaxID=285578 RepID=UPI00344F6D72
MAESRNESGGTEPLVAGESAAAGAGDPAEILLGVLREHLSVQEIGMDDRFYALGGDSLIALRVLNDAREQGVPLTLRDLMVHQSVRAILGSRSAAAPPPGGGSPAGHGPAGSAAPFSLLDPEDRARIPEGVQDALPASALQTGMLYLCETSQDPLLYHSMDGWEVAARFDESSFRTALDALARRHPALRTAFDFGGLSVPAQLVWADARPALTVERAADADEGDALLRAWCDQQLAAPIDWRVPSLVRCHVVALPDSFHTVLAVHHAVLDGWSLSRLAVELMTLYAAAHDGVDAELPALSPDVQHDFLAAERRAADSPAAAAHWLRQADAPALLFDAAKHRKTPDAGGRVEFALDATLVRALSGVARMLGVPVKAVALAAHVRALGTWTRRDHDIVTGLVFNTRPESAGSDLAAGLFLNTLPVRFATVDATWAGLVRAAADAESEGAAHQAYPQAQIVERLGRPPFDVTFNFMHFHAYRELDRLTSVPTRGWWRRGKPSFPFHVNVEISGAEGQVRIGFDPAFVARTSVEAYASTLRRALAALVANPVSPAAPSAPGNKGK